MEEITTIGEANYRHFGVQKFKRTSDVTEDNAPHLESMVGMFLDFGAQIF